MTRDSISPIWRVIMTVLWAATLAPSYAQDVAPGGEPEGRSDAIVIGQAERHLHLAPLKDENLAIILSVGTPGLGQLYVGEWQRGVAFLGGVAASLMAVGVAGDNLSLTVEDYDAMERGGNGDGVVDVNEYTRWEDKPRKSFGDLSTGRKAVVLGGLGTAVALYVWNIIDARSCAVEHNRRIYAELTGIRVSMNVDGCGIVMSRLNIPF